MTAAWPAGSATGIGSLPFLDPREAVRVVLGELGQLPHLPELPGRGPGADMVGRTAALLVEMPVEVQPSGWRIAARPGRDLRRARSYLGADLDALEEFAGAHAGSLKVQVCGPWTLAAGVENPAGHRALVDAGLVADLAASLAEGLRGHLAAVRRRLPHAEVVLQLDEPAVPAVLAGAVPTASGFGRIGAYESVVVQDVLARVVAAAGLPTVVHCCGANPPVALFRGAGAAAVSFDLGLVSVPDEEALGTAVDAGMSLWVGAVPATPATPQATALLPAQRQQAARAPLAGPGAPMALALDPLRALWRRIGFGPEVARARTVVTPTCGLAGADVAYARAALTRTRELARAFAEEPGGAP